MDRWIDGGGCRNGRLDTWSDGFMDECLRTEIKDNLVQR